MTPGFTIRLDHDGTPSTWLGTWIGGVIWESEKTGAHVFTDEQEARAHFDWHRINLFGRRCVVVLEHPSKGVERGTIRCPANDRATHSPANEGYGDGAEFCVFCLRKRADDLAAENAELRAKLAAAPDSIGDWPAPEPMTPEQAAAASEMMRVGGVQSRRHADEMLAGILMGADTADPSETTTARVCLMCGARLGRDAHAYPLAEKGFACGSCWDNAATGVPVSVWRRDRSESAPTRPPWCTVADLVAAGIPIPFPYDPAKVIDEAERMMRGPEPDPDVTAAVVALAAKRLQRRGMP